MGGLKKIYEFEGKKYKPGRLLDGEKRFAGQLFINPSGTNAVNRLVSAQSYNNDEIWPTGDGRPVYEAVEVPAAPLTTITETITKEIKAPDGYEFESGEKRVPNKGELYLNEMFGGVQVCDYQPGPRYILRKIKKGPRTFYAAEYVDGIGSVGPTKAEAEENAKRVGSSIGIVKLIEVIE